MSCGALGRLWARCGGAFGAAGVPGGCPAGRGLFAEAGERGGRGAGVGRSGPGFYDTVVEQWSRKPLQPKPALRAMVSRGTANISPTERVLKSAQFVQAELPKRLARRLMDLQFLPYIVVINPHIKRVYDAYYHAFVELIKEPPVDTVQRNRDFSAKVKLLIEQHTDMVDSLAAGLRECLQKPGMGEQLQLDNFLDGMLRSRITRRVMAEQHIALQQQRPGYVGAVATDLDLRKSIEFAAMRAQQISKETYGTAPDFAFSADVRVKIAYLPTHLDYMLFELMKNAMRATVERGMVGGGQKRMPPIRVRVCDGDAVTIRISDQGGGIPPEAMESVWKYGFTTARTESSEAAGGEEHFSGVPDLSGRPSAGQSGCMAGLGFGLPLTRLHAQYFGGDLKLHPMPGYGTDAFLKLSQITESVH